MIELKNQPITGIYISEDARWLVFDTNNGRVGYEGIGDCCSDTWFADIVGVKSLLYCRVLSVKNMEVPDVQDKRCRQEFDRFYGVKLSTEQGTCDIVFRNSSNGYYSGCIEFRSQDFPPDTELLAVTDDYPEHKPMPCTPPTCPNQNAPSPPVKSRTS